MKVRRTQYEPGNGSRYDLSWYHDFDGYLVVTWWWRGGSGGSSIRVNSVPTLEYVAEKMSIPPEHTKDLEALVGAIETFLLNTEPFAYRDPE